MDTSDHGLSHNFKGLKVVANWWTDIKPVLVKFLFIFNWRWMQYDFKVSPQIQI